MENSWTIEQTKALFALVTEAKAQGRGLNHAFRQMSAASGRSENSVRNYYYSQLKMFELLPGLASDLGITLERGRRESFELFTPEQIRELLERVLLGKAQGVSVRKTIAQMAAGDAKTALRLQNKYRSMILHHRNVVTDTMRRLAAQGKTYFDPYSKQVSDGSPDNYRKLADYLGELSEAEMGAFVKILHKLSGAQ